MSSSTTIVSSGRSCDSDGMREIGGAGEEGEQRAEREGEEHGGGCAHVIGRGREERDRERESARERER